MVDDIGTQVANYHSYYGYSSEVNEGHQENEEEKLDGPKAVWGEGKRVKKYRRQRDTRGHVSGLRYKNWNFSFYVVSFLGQNGTDHFCYSLLCVSGQITITIDLGPYLL